MSNKNSSAIGGFTLLEIMIALSIVAIALVVMLGLAQRSVLVNGRIQNMTRATLLAKQKMAEIENNINLEISQTKGSFTEPNQDFSWQKVSTPTPISGIVQIDLSVIWGDEKENEVITLTSFIKEVGL